MKLKFKTTKANSKSYDNYQEHVWSLEDQLNLEDVLSTKEFSKFKHCGTVVKSDNAAGYTISLEESFVNKPFVIYIVTYRGKVLKGGKSKNSLDTRSYGAGTEESWTMKGTPSVTNYVWSQIFREVLNSDEQIKFYGVVVPSFVHTFESFDGEMVTKICSPYEEEEKKLNSLLNRLNGKKVIGEGKLLEPFKK